MYGLPYNVVAGNQALAPINITNYAKESEPGPVPFPANMSIQSWYSPSGNPPAPGQVTADHHAIVLRRDETSGGIDRLYEYYQVESSDKGATWTSVGGARFDLTTGAVRPDGWSSSDAGGLPMIPLCARYDEAVRGAINHPIRVVIPGPLSRNRYVWPARHTAFSGSPDKGLPMGARLRLSQSWYNANRDRFSSINRAIVDALRNYGLIVADLADSGFEIDGVNDERWDDADLLKLQTIPVSAFEVLDTIKPALSFTGPSSGSAGVPQTFTVRYLIAQNSNFGCGWYAYSSSDGGKTWSDLGMLKIDDKHRSATVKFTPLRTGSYIQDPVQFIGLDRAPTSQVHGDRTDLATSTNAPVARSFRRHLMARRPRLP